MSETHTQLLASLLDVRAVAALLCCSTRHVRRLADTGRMPRPVHVQALQDAIAVFEGKDHFEGPEHTVHVRLAEYSDKIYLD
jgi:hypothetical protein